MKRLLILSLIVKNEKWLYLYLVFDKITMYAYMLCIPSGKTGE